MSLATARRRLAELRVEDMPCSTCHATRGVPCVNRNTGQLVKDPHAARVAAYDACHAEALRLVQWEETVAGGTA